MRNTEKITAWVLGSISISLTAFIVWWWLKNPRLFIDTRLGIAPDVFELPMPWLLMLVVTVGYIAYTAKFVPFVRQNLFTFSCLKVIGIWAAITTGIVEEIVFRQMLMDGLMNAGWAIPWQIAASAVIFGIAHATWTFLRGEWKVALPVVFSTTVLGALLAILYIVADRSTLPSIIAHVIINLAIEPWLILAAVAGKLANAK